MRTNKAIIKQEADDSVPNTWLGIENYTKEDADRATDVQLHSSVPDGKLVVLTARQLITEYDCHTTSERAMGRLAANAYARILENSRVLAELVQHEKATQLYINLYSTMSKELDRATRQFDTAISNLIRMKSPSMNVSVTAKTAFVANNQQFNVNQNSHENIKPK